MFDADQYRLLDFGDGEKLEFFSGVKVRRPSPVATGKKHSPSLWSDSVEYRVSDGGSQKSGQWLNLDSTCEDWRLKHGDCSFQLKPTPFGHLGVFPEQAANWSWVENLKLDLKGLKVLNLFAYTGGTTLAFAARGAEVSHVDSAKNIVQWARKNAELSGMSDARIRWLAEDAMRFLEREIKRGNRYDIVVADPPSFGRGPKNETWKIQRDFETLVGLLAELTGGQCKVLLLSCHTPGFESPHLKESVAKFFDISKRELEAFSMALKSDSNRKLPSGHCVRWSSDG